jgi:hypothetical protein
MAGPVVEFPVSVMNELQEVRLHLLLDSAVKSIPSLEDLTG